jgi:hypothetical protein
MRDLTKDCTKSQNRITPQLPVPLPTLRGGRGRHLPGPPITPQLPGPGASHASAAPALGTHHPREVAP